MSMNNMPTTDGFNQAMQNYKQAIANQLNNPMPYISTPPEVAKLTLEGHKVWVVLEWDDEFETAKVRAVFTSKDRVDTFLESQNRKAYLEVEETTLDAEVFADDVDKTE